MGVKGLTLSPYVILQIDNENIGCYLNFTPTSYNQVTKTCIAARIKEFTIRSWELIL